MNSSSNTEVPGKRKHKPDLRLQQGLSVFLFVLCIRLLALVPTTLGLNPESKADAVGFAQTAEAIAQGIMQGQLLAPHSSSTYNLWGAFLSPFWLVPGPSLLYARLGNALLGAIAIYNVYLIARYYRTHQAGIIAILPMAVFPSYVAIHTTVLREAIVLFAITLAARVLILPSNKRYRVFTYVVAGTFLLAAYIHRPDNAIIYAISLGAGLFAYGIKSGIISRRALLAVLAASPIGLILARSYIQSGIEFLARTRDLRATGRAVYLPEVIPTTAPELLAFSWVGAVYFLYTPFPWMVETVADLLVSIQVLISIGFTVAAIWGIRSLGQKNAPATVGLLVGFAVAVVLYGVGTSNYGTGMRHRQMFMWVIFLFGGIGIAEHIRFVWPFRWSSDLFSSSNSPTDSD